MPKQEQDKPNAKPSYDQFIKSIELVAMAIIDSRFHVHRQSFIDDKDEEIFVRLTARPSRVGRDFFEIQATAQLKSSKSRKARGSLEIEAVYELHIHAKPPFNRQLISRFADSDLRIMLWPYLREYVTSCCARMYVPPIVLPLPERT